MFNLVEAAKVESNVQKRGIMMALAESTPVMEQIRFMDIAGNAFSYNSVAGLSGVGFRGFNDQLNETNLVLNQNVETLKTLQALSEVDRAVLKTRIDKEGLQAAILKDKIMSMGYAFTHAFFLGDSGSNPRSFDGLRVRLGNGPQVFNSVTFDSGGRLTLEALDRLLLSVSGPNSTKTLYLGIEDYATFLRLVRQHGTVVVDRDAFGGEVMTYNKAQIRVIEPYDIVRQIPESAGVNHTETVNILGKTEPLNTSSIYCVRFGRGEEHLTGLRNSSGLDVRNYVKEPFVVTDVEMIAGFALFNGRAAARLQGIV